MFTGRAPLASRPISCTIPLRNARRVSADSGALRARSRSNAAVRSGYGRVVGTVMRCMDGVHEGHDQRVRMLR
jgi:hypothetical protein